jgi:hypothetical protein
MAEISVKFKDRELHFGTGIPVNIFDGEMPGYSSTVTVGDYNLQAEIEPEPFKITLSDAPVQMRYLKMIIA